MSRQKIIPAPIRFEIENAAACLEALARLIHRLETEDEDS